MTVYRVTIRERRAVDRGGWTRTAPGRILKRTPWRPALAGALNDAVDWASGKYWPGVARAGTRELPLIWSDPIIGGRLFLAVDTAPDDAATGTREQGELSL